MSARAAWLVAAALTASAGAAVAQPAPSGGATAATGAAVVATPSKKDSYLADKAVAAAGKRRKRTAVAPGKKPAPVVSIFNTWTHEWIVVDRDGKRLPEPAQVDRFLRCHFTNQATEMRRELIATLRDAASHFAAKRIDIVSGYRSPKYNLMLRKKGHEVARDSQHTQGHAVDFRIPGVDVKTLEAWARGRRKGGVGLYLGSKFIHVDTGPVRTWNGT